MQETKGINKVVYLSNNDILPNRFQPRKYFDEEEILQLSESIKEHGVINPIIVRNLGDKYELVAGERRYKANILAGNDNIPAIIMDVNDKESSEIAVVENIQRKDLNAIEEAISYKRILDIGYMTQEQLAQKMGKSQSAIANKVRLLKLSDEVQDALMKKMISERHARSLLKVPSHKKQNELLERIINERLTVRKTDEEIEKMNNSIYNNNPESLAPIMPGSNVSDVNISGNPNSINNNIDNNMFSSMNAVPSQQPEVSEQSVMNPNIQPEVSKQSVMNQSIQSTEASMFNTNEQATSSEPQTIPTVSIDDVLAKANQPSVVGLNANASNNNLDNSFESDNSDTFGMPSLEAINENPTPIETTEQEFGSSMPSFNPISESINENSFEMPSVSQENETVQPSDLNQPFDFSTSNLNSINEVENEKASAVDSISTPDFTMPSNDFMDISNNNNNQNNDTFSNFNLNKEENQVSTPINTTPIIDTTGVNSDQQMMSNVNDDIINNNIASTVNQPQIEKAPEPIIVNEYDEQYDPIMPDKANEQPTIDFKTIINLIRKCSQAIENSGYKIETEEYNLDNVYQVVFKIDKQ